MSAYILKLKVLSLIITLDNFELSLNALNNISIFSILLKEISIVVKLGHKLKLPVDSCLELAPIIPKFFKAQYEAVSCSNEGQYPKDTEARS